MATSAVNQVPLTQPAFASQLSATRDRAMGVTPNLQHGYMIWDVSGGNAGYSGGPYGGRCAMNFMYNPQSIAATYALGDTSIQAALLYNAPGASSIVATPLSQAVSWTLYFDRTYEVNYNTPNNTPNDPAVIGVQADVVQMMQFTGMLSNMASGLTGSTSTSPVANKGGLMMNIYSWVYFGQNVNQRGIAPNNNVAAENRLGYFGFVSGWDVTYTAFTQNMVPYRCTIDVSFQLLSPSASTVSNGAMAQGILDPYGNLKNYTSLLSPVKAP